LNWSSHLRSARHWGCSTPTIRLATQGHVVNRKRVQRLMRLLGLVAIYQRPNTSKPAVAHKIYPYLLGGLAIERVNQVWCADVAFAHIPTGTTANKRFDIDEVKGRIAAPASTMTAIGADIETGRATP
jgi:transposase InsO family protein